MSTCVRVAQIGVIALLLFAVTMIFYENSLEKTFFISCHKTGFRICNYRTDKVTKPKSTDLLTETVTTKEPSKESNPTVEIEIEPKSALPLKSSINPVDEVSFSSKVSKYYDPKKSIARVDKMLTNLKARIQGIDFGEDDEDEFTTTTNRPILHGTPKPSSPTIDLSKTSEKNIKSTDPNKDKNKNSNLNSNLSNHISEHLIDNNIKRAKDVDSKRPALQGQKQTKDNSKSSLRQSQLEKTTSSIDSNSKIATRVKLKEQTTSRLNAIRTSAASRIRSTTQEVPLDPLSPTERSLTDVELKKRQKGRQEVLDNFCKTIKEPSKLDTAKIFVSPNQHVLYCSIPKVACTNWKRMMLIFDGMDYKEAYALKKQKVHTRKFSILASFNKTKVKDMSKNYYSFLFVRHPYERLLSAYRNKFQDPYNSVFQRRYGSKILRMHRNNLTKEEIKSGVGVTFSEFINYIIWTDRIKKPHDEHWRPYDQLCSPCRLKYDFLGKMETLADDSDSILKDLKVFPKWRFPISYKDKYKTPVSTYIDKYFNALTTKVKKELFRIYRFDFEAFGYPLPDVT